MIDATLAEALTWPTDDEIEKLLLAELTDADFQVNDFHSGSVMRTLLELEKDSISDLVQEVIPIMLARGFVDTTDKKWLAALAHSLYAVDKRLGSAAMQVVGLACLPGKGPFPLLAGQLFFTATDGRRFLLATGATVATSGTTLVDVIGESPGKALGLVNAIVSPPPGLTLVSAAIKIVSAVPQYGSDDETDESVIARCFARWPPLDPPYLDRMEIWARAGSSEVTRLKLDIDTANPGGVIISIAGPAGAVSLGAVTAVQTYIDERTPITDFVTVQNSFGWTITPGGTITVAAGRKEEIAAAAQAVWNAYLLGVNVGGFAYVGVLIQAIMDAGAIDCQVGADSSVGWGFGGALVAVPDPTSFLILFAWVEV